jgi:hypothetical protein
LQEVLLICLTSTQKSQRQLWYRGLLEAEGDDTDKRIYYMYIFDYSCFILKYFVCIAQVN